MNRERLDEEKKYLERTKKLIAEEITYQEKEIREIPNRYTKRYADTAGGDEDLIANLQKIAIQALHKLERMPNNPYFGRIDFTEEGKEKLNKIYVGKTTIRDENDIVVTDWRAPVCSLYYDQSLGNVSYKAPKGEVFGNLSLKSQIIIDKGELIDVRDTDLVTDDELLLPYLTTNADARLKNIVASIQSEQNAIIRKPLNKNIIVQGVAGSGKTTVALHRAAYLIYNEDKYTAENFIIIGPNKYFLNYISALLPDLDTENISQFTFEDFSTYFFGDKISINNSKTITDKDEIEALKFKTTLDYKMLIDNYITSYVDKTISGGIKIDDFEIISEDTIKSYFVNANGFSKVATNIQKILVKKIKDNDERLYDLIKQKYSDQLSALENGSKEKIEILNKLDSIKKELKTGCSKTVKDYFKPLKLNYLNLYKDFITNINDMPNLKKQTLKSIKSKEFCFEDLPALIYFDMVFNGTENLEFNKYAHVIIDEAQDLGMFHYWVLKSIFNNATFSIFGDQAQSIYPSRGIESWEDVKTEVFNDNCEVLNLNKSYRTTMEITNSANQILDYLDLTEAQPVIRTGYNVEYYNQDISNINDKILDLIYNYNEKGYKSIGIICRSEEECLEKYSYLNNEDITSSLISNEDSEYNGGICVLTSELSKGLEFDGVIITNASEKNYSSENLIDMKLLYVAMTRALHSLNILYTDQLTRPLSNNMSKENGKELIKKI